MALQLFLLRPDARGHVALPTWDEDGELTSLDTECVGDADWAAFQDADVSLADCGLTPTTDLVPAAELAASATRGLVRLMLSLMRIHPDFARWTPAQLEAPGTYDAAWMAFSGGHESLGGDRAARAAAALRTSQLWTFRLLFERIRQGGQDGCVGWWSF